MDEAKTVMMKILDLHQSVMSNFAVTNTSVMWIGCSGSDLIIQIPFSFANQIRAPCSVPGFEGIFKKIF